jgi:hypothetical protein
VLIAAKDVTTPDESYIRFRTTEADLDGFNRAVSDVYEYQCLNKSIGNVSLHYQGAALSETEATPYGFVGVALGIESHEHLRVWLAALANRLERAGFTGILEGAELEPLPVWIEYALSRRLGKVTERQPAAFIAWTRNLDDFDADESRDSHWHVPAQRTEAICEMVAGWAEPGGDTAQAAGSVFRFAVPDWTILPRFLIMSLTVNHSASLLRHTSLHQRARTVALSPSGNTGLQILDGATDWQSRLNELRHGMTQLLAFTDLAFIRPAAAFAISWTDLHGLRGIQEADVRDNMHLIDRYVPDAHGIQVLTANHLANARDLSQWRVTELDHDRYLVEAADLAPWYATEQPDPATVESARNDFGPMILTKDVITANPPRWRRHHT